MFSPRIRLSICVVAKQNAALTQHGKGKGKGRVIDAPHPTTPTVVVIDDDRDLLQLIILLLSRIDVQTVTFANGREAVHHLRTEIPDLIILDLMLPDVDGLEFLRQVRKHSRFDQVPVLILSAKADPDTIREGLDSGADAYVTKPYLANNLLDRVRMLLEQRRKRLSGMSAGPAPDD